MNKDMMELDILHKEIENYIDPDLQPMTFLDEGERSYFDQHKEEIFTIYNQAVQRFRILSLAWSPEEVMEGFLTGGALLHRALGGHMSMDQHFDERYVPIMKEAILRDESPTIYHFLFTLAKRVTREETLELVGIGLNSKQNRMVDSALRVAAKEKLKELIPQIQQIASKESPTISEVAKNTLDILK